MKYSLHAFMSMQSFCIYHIYLRILFLIYQFQFLSLCHSREAEDILKYLVVVIPAARVLTLLYSVFQQTTPW